MIENDDSVWVMLAIIKKKVIEYSQQVLNTKRCRSSDVDNYYDFSWAHC